VVLGHEGCGAVAAATSVIDGAQVPPSYIRDVAERITPNVLRARQAGAVTADEIGSHHTVMTVDLLRRRSALIDDALRRGTVEAVAARYSLTTGAVTEVRQPALAGV
jgi:carbonic anhydrase